MNNKWILATVLLLAVIFSVSSADSSQSNETNNSNETKTQKNINETPWKRYQDTNSNSGIVRYKYGSNWIRVEFKESSVYEYTYKSAGKNNVEKMKMLADSRNGLNSFINKNVRKKYSKKFPKTMD